MSVHKSSKEWERLKIYGSQPEGPAVAISMLDPLTYDGVFE